MPTNDDGQSNHPIEKATDREWLVAKCKDWVAKIDGHIVDLKQDKKDCREVLKEANDTANKMQQTLKDKAFQLTWMERLPLQLFKIEFENGTINRLSALTKLLAWNWSDTNGTT